MTFDRPEALAINWARLTHLASLGLPLDGTSVLEVGAGPGMLTGFFEERSCVVTSTDGRAENVRAMRARRPGLRAELVDLNQPGSHSHLGRFDVVFCYGTLYHTADPARVLADLAGVCDGLFLLESIVWPQDDGRVHPVGDNPALADQSLDGRGNRPARDWLWHELGKHFDYVYAPRTQPDHPDYPLYFPVQPAPPGAGSAGNVRAVFVASRRELRPEGVPTLAAYLPRVYARLSI